MWRVHGKFVDVLESPLFWFSRSVMDVSRKGLVEYASGVSLDHESGRVWVSYGAGDCFARYASLPASSLVELLRHVRRGVQVAPSRHMINFLS